MAGIVLLLFMVLASAVATKLYGPFGDNFLNTVIWFAVEVAVFLGVVIIAGRIRAQRQSPSTSGRAYTILLIGVAGFGGIAMLSSLALGRLGDDPWWMDLVSELGRVAIGVILLWQSVTRFRSYTQG